jgi:hypothetical protein
MSFPIPDAEKYIAFRRVTDIVNLEFGWVVIAVLETENPMQVYLNNGQQGYGQQKTIEFLIGLPGSREQADLFAEKERAKVEAALISSNFDRAKREWEETEKKLKNHAEQEKATSESLQKRLNDVMRLRDTLLADNEHLKGESAKLKESIATVMLMVGENGKATVADLTQAKAVGERMGEEDAKKSRG